MEFEVIIHARARHDIAYAFYYIEAIAPDAAGRWFKRMQDAVEGLATMPSRCALAPEAEEIGHPIQQLIVGKRSSAYRIVFRIDEGARRVHVLTVRHGARKPLSAEDLE